MQKRRSIFLAGASLPFVAGAQSFNIGGMVRSAQGLAAAGSLTDEQVRGYASQMAKKVDAEATLAPADGPHAKRLQSLTSGLAEDGGIKLNFKVFQMPEINAFALADGSIRLFTGLLDSFTDDEVRYVIGHEIGHVVAGHSRSRMQTALLTGALRDAAASSGNAKVAALADSAIGELFGKVVRAQHSQSNETAADEYAFKFMQRRNWDPKACVSALEKLAALSDADGDRGNWLSTHPSPRDRAKHMAKLLA